MFFLISVWSIRLTPCFLDRSVGNENSGNVNTAALDRTSASPWTARYVPSPTYPYPRVRSITVYRYNCLIHRQVNTVDRFDSEFGATEDTYATGKQSLSLIHI